MSCFDCDYLFTGRVCCFIFFFNDTAPTEIYTYFHTLSLHDALPILAPTWVAYITDRSRDKHLGIAVGMLNFAGTLPAIIDLWTRGQSHQTAMLLKIGRAHV